MGGWTIAFRRVRQLESVPENIRHKFQLLWFEENTLWSDDKHALLDALHVLFVPYQGPAVRLFRGAPAPEARSHKFYRPSWTADIELADLFARHKQIEFGGSVVNRLVVGEANRGQPANSEAGIGGSPRFGRAFCERPAAVAYRFLHTRAFCPVNCPDGGAGFPHDGTNFSAYPSLAGGYNLFQSCSLRCRGVKSGPVDNEKSYFHGMDSCLLRHHGRRPQWTEAVVFGYLIVIMVLRPRGLLGEETREAG